MQPILPDDYSVQHAIADLLAATDQLRKRQPKPPGISFVDWTMDQALSVSGSALVMALMLSGFGLQHVVIATIVILVMQLSGLALLCVAIAWIAKYFWKLKNQLVISMSREHETSRMLAIDLWQRRPHKAVLQDAEILLRRQLSSHKQRQAFLLALAGVTIVLLFPSTPNGTCPINSPRDLFGALLASPFKPRLDLCTLQAAASALLLGLVLGAAFLQRWIHKIHQAGYLASLALSSAEQDHPPFRPAADTELLPSHQP